MIAEWWHSQKVKQHRDGDINTLEDFIEYRRKFSGMDLVDSTVIIERFLKVQSLEPFVLTEDYSQLVIKRPDGKKCIIQKFEGKQEKEFESIPMESIIENSCSNCKHEVYWKDGIDKEIYGTEVSFNRRDCSSSKTEVQEFFKKKVKITLSKGEIPPVENCPFWQGINGFDKSTEKKKLPGKLITNIKEIKLL
jgi:hypothetical protein